MKFYHSRQRSTWDITIAHSGGKHPLHRIFSLFLSFMLRFWVFFSLYWLALRIGNAKFRITFRYLNIYVSIWKYPQIFLYMSTKYCESFKSFGELGEKFLLATFMTPKFRHLQKITWIYLSSTQFWSPQHWLNTDCILCQYIENTFKKSLNVYDTWFGFYIHFKKVTFVLPYDHHRHKWVNGIGIENLSNVITIVKLFFFFLEKNNVTLNDYFHLPSNMTSPTLFNRG